MKFNISFLKPLPWNLEIKYNHLLQLWGFVTEHNVSRASVLKVFSGKEKFLGCSVGTNILWNYYYGEMTKAVIWAVLHSVFYGIKKLSLMVSFAQLNYCPLHTWRGMVGRLASYSVSAGFNSQPRGWISWQVFQFSSVSLASAEIVY